MVHTKVQTQTYSGIGGMQDNTHWISYAYYILYCCMRRLYTDTILLFLDRICQILKLKIIDIIRVVFVCLAKTLNVRL